MASTSPVLSKAVSRFQRTDYSRLHRPRTISMFSHGDGIVDVKLPKSAISDSKMLMVKPVPVNKALEIIEHLLGKSLRGLQEYLSSKEALWVVNIEARKVFMDGDLVLIF